MYTSTVYSYTVHVSFHSTSLYLTTLDAEDKPTWLFYLSNVLMYNNKNLVDFTYSLRSIHNFVKKKDVNLNNKVLSLMLHAGSEGNYRCRKKFTLPANANHQRKRFCFVFLNEWKQLWMLYQYVLYHWCIWGIRW